ncbi:kinetochore protein NDC80 homolog isoform X2 [Uranotaenia lowii]|nr:kinetochore protein NDC80 homolog isoform X2 [Uranotaenia lowii]
MATRRTTASNVTPASRTPLRNCENAPVPATVEKNKAPVENREWMAAQTERICDYLGTITDLPQEFVERRNLKAMTINQFLMIMKHLFRQIGGSRYKINNIDDIMKTMVELEYPYTVNKSMLKTPNVPHSFGHIIVLLGWLVQLVPAQQQLPPLKRDTALLEGIASIEYQEFFLEQVQEGFELWNAKKEDEFEALIDELTDKLVVARTNGLNQAEVRKRTAELERDLQDIVDRTVREGREQSMDGLVKLIHEQQQKKKKLQDEIKTLQKQVNKVEEEYFVKQENYYAREKKLDELKQEIKSQQLAAFERDELIAKLSANKNMLTAKKLAVSTLEHASFDHQIAISRAIQQKTSMFSELNTKLHNFSNHLKPFIDFEPPTIDLKTENYLELQHQLTETKAKVYDILDQQSSMYKSMNEGKSQLEHQLSDLATKHATIERALEETTTRHEQLVKLRDTILGQLSEVNVEISQATHRKDTEQVEIDRSIAELSEQLDRNVKAIEQLTIQKQKLMHEKLEECQAVLQKKKDSQQALIEKVRQIEAVVAGVERELGRE